jgi:Replication initiation factor
MADAMCEIESRVDWITATSLLQHWTHEIEAEHNALLSQKLLHREEAAGNRIRHSSMFGFSGLACGGVFVGRSGQGYLYRLSGDAAAVWWHDVYHASTNVSRLDVASTIQRWGDRRDLSYVHAEEARSHARVHSPRTKVTRIDGGASGRTVNIGSRTSEAYGRIYDKHAESKRAEYEFCWRYETEFKRVLAKSAANLLDPCSGLAAAPGEMARGWFGRRGIGLEQCRASSSLPSSAGRPTEVQSRLRWLRTGVSGSTAFLIERGMIKEVLAALKLTSDVLESAGYFKQSIMPHERGD